MSLPPVERELQCLSPRYAIVSRAVVAIGRGCLGLLLLSGAGLVAASFAVLRHARPRLGAGPALLSGGDEGTGLDPARRVVSESITGRGDVRPAPGRGAVVGLEWPGEAVDAVASFAEKFSAGTSPGPDEVATTFLRGLWLRWFFGQYALTRAGQRAGAVEASRMRRLFAEGDDVRPGRSRVVAGMGRAAGQVRVSQLVRRDRHWVEVTWTAQPVPTRSAGRTVPA